MGFFEAWRKRKAAKRIAARLPAILSASYGGADHYTVPQIRVAFGHLKLRPRDVDIAFAAYLDFEAYAAETGQDQASYATYRSLFQRYLPDGYSSPGSAPVNEYIQQLTGLS
ncbi:MAG: hypothetical protein JSR86_12560 [Proteobacteria bacterium]|nr:hypothetical protein [Pseudomonadota bacterium]